MNQSEATVEIIDAEDEDQARDAVVDNVIELGRIWLRSGLTIGKHALKTSARAVEQTAEALGNIAEELGAETDAAPETTQRDF